MIDKLTYFVALAREQSFRRAAEQCGVAQPTLSAGIKQLEEELGVMLVLRRSRMLGLTPEGERVLEWARRLVGDARAMRQELQGMRTGLSGHIRLAVVPTALASTPMLTGPVLRRHPGLRFTILSCTSDRIRHMLDGLEVDAGITYLGTEILGRVRTVPLYTERYVFVTTVDGALGDRETVRWAELAGVRLCLLTPDMQNRRIVDQLMRGAGVEPRAMMESDSQVALVAHVASGGWAAVLPERVAETLAGGASLRRIALVEPEALYQIGLVVPEREPLPLLASALLVEARLLL